MMREPNPHLNKDIHVHTYIHTYIHTYMHTHRYIPQLWPNNTKHHSGKQFRYHSAAMGSYGDRWLYCTFCGKRGKNLLHPLPVGTPSLIDIDGTGILCDPCYDRGCPPHYDWLENMLRTKLGQATTETTILITDYTFQRCADYKAAIISNAKLCASLASSSSQ